MAASRDILLQTPNIAAAADFYRSALGLTVFLRTPQMIGLEAGSLRLYLEAAEPLGPVLEFFVEDLETAKADLTAQGATILVEDPGIPRCYLRDPFGLTFNLAERTQPAQASEDQPEEL